VYHQISRWISDGGSWQEGTALYQAHGADSFVLKLCQGPETSFSRKKLDDAMHELIKDQAPIVQIAEVVKQETPEWQTKKGVENYTSLPAKLQDKYKQVRSLYKEVIRLRKQAHKIMATADRRPITLQEAFEIMEQVDTDGMAIPFILTYVTHNADTLEGGEVIQAKAKLRIKEKKMNRFIATPQRFKKTKRNPRHSDNGTVNIQLTSSWEYRTVHTWLIFEINGIPVEIGNNG
jgi:hypothetical protein